MNEEIKILVVDDDPVVRKVLESALSEYGQIVSAQSGNQAITTLKEGHCDIILTDHSMEDGNGLDIMKYLKETSVQTPVIFVTFISTIEMLTELINFQVFGIIEKPFVADQIKSIIERAIEKVYQDRHHEKLIRIGLTAAELMHEISNPLALMTLGVEALTANPQDVKYISTIQKGLNRTISLVEKTKARIRGRSAMSFSTSMLGDIIEQAQEEFSAKALQSGVQIETEGPGDVPIFCDQDGIREIVVNLVNNAIDAVAPLNEKWIKISIKSGPKGVLLTVIDSGTGIPEVVKRKLFTTLFTTKGKSGTGLGLGICRRIAHEHGGNLYLVSDSKNTAFALVLPKSSKTQNHLQSVQQG